MAERPLRLVLVGFMGAGKTTVGRLAARALGWSFLDMDAEIERRAGRTVAEIFRERGEAGFREEERRLALEIRGLERHVIAAGGGAFAVAETREALQQGALCVWLRCEPAVALARLPPDGARPLAANRERIACLFAEREPAYRLADRQVDASLPPEDVVRRVVELMG